MSFREMPVWRNVWNRIDLAQSPERIKTETNGFIRLHSK